MENNNILEQLRNVCIGHTHSASTICLIARAAEEIEILIEENNHLRSLIYSIDECLDATDEKVIRPFQNFEGITDEDVKNFLNKLKKNFNR